jgi:PAS domain S-box-containing protein
MDETLVNLGINLMLFTDPSGTIRYGKAVDLESRQDTALPEGLQHLLLKQWPVFSFETYQESRRGLLMLPQGPLLVGAAPIVTSHFEGPVRGTLIAGRFVDKRLLKQWADTIGSQVRYTTMSDSASDSALLEAAAEPEGADVWVRALDTSTIAGFAILRDAYGNPGILLEIKKPRDIFQQARSTLFIYSLSILIVALVFGSVFWLLLDNQVLARLTRLAKDVSHIARHKDFQKRLLFHKQDEVAQVATSINDLLAALERTTNVLVNREKDLQSILTGTPVGILLIDAETRRITWGNPNALKIIGKSEQEIKDHPCPELICSTVDRHYRLLDSTTDAEEQELLRSDGTKLPVLKSYAKVTYQGRPHLLETLLDISDRKRLEAELQRAQKMETIGLLASGVAHDLNNILTVLIGYPDLLLTSLPTDNELVEPLNELKRSSEKAARLVEDLLNLARRGVPATEVISLHNIIQEYQLSAQQQQLEKYASGVQFEWHLSEGNEVIEGSSVHLSKALMNLVVNASEAIMGTGKVTVANEVRSLDHGIKCYETIPPGDYAVLSVSDTGSGIKAQDLAKIFEPFYTSKAMGRSGTGLGMTVVWNAVKDMGGYIDVKSTEGKGSTFELYFPLSKRQYVPPPQPAPAEDLRGAGEKILVVDDLPEQQKMARAVLERLDYQVATVSSGEEALEYLRENSAALLLLDMNLGTGLDGLDTYREILKLNPRQQVIIVTGYAETERINEVLKLGAALHLQKPYRANNLGQAVKTILSGMHTP